MLEEVNIKRGIFQGDSLSPPLFIKALILLTLVLRKMKAGYHLGEGKGIQQKRESDRQPSAVSQSHHHRHVEHGVQHQQMRNPNYEKGKVHSNQGH